jgi:hypothetical protein
MSIGPALPVYTSGVGSGLYMVGVANPDAEIGLNIFNAIGGQKRV